MFKQLFPAISVLILTLAAATSPAQQASPMEFVKIPAGEFLMGCSAQDADCYDNEKPSHRVRLTKPFEIGKYEVTQAQWDSVMGSNRSGFKGSDRPVEQISWNEIQEFLRKLNATRDGYVYRLPTEAEWEYAARAGSTTPYAGVLDELAWYSGNSTRQTHPVGRKQANAWGLFDMHGNVWEWVQDWDDAGYYAKSAGVDPAGPTSGRARIVRGGSWVNLAGDLRVSFRIGLAPTLLNSSLGFRCVREVRREP